MIENIPDAPWIKEVEATGYYKYGWWNNPPDSVSEDNEPFAVYDPD